MRGPRLRTTIKSVVAILCAACFLTLSLGSVSRGVAADAWETWPKKTTVPGVTPNPERGANRSAKAEDAAGKNTAKGKSNGKTWWITAGAAVVIGIAIAIAAGGSGGDGGGSTNPGHH
jgi:anti-sigma-K factor RskA